MTNTRLPSGSFRWAEDRAAQHVAELAEVTDRLARVVDARYIPVWMVKPVEALDDCTPVALIASGQARRVARLISELESPGAA